MTNAQPPWPPPPPPPSGPPPSDAERRTAMWCYLGPLLLTFLTCGLGSLIAWVIPLVLANRRGRESYFIRHHASQSLNFAIEMFIAGFVSAILLFAFLGFILLPCVIVWELVFAIIASSRAANGQWYQIPANLTVVKL
jgi:uncharacterized protein